LGGCICRSAVVCCCGYPSVSLSFWFDAFSASYFRLPRFPFPHVSFCALDSFTGLPYSTFGFCVKDISARPAFDPIQPSPTQATYPNHLTNPHSQCLKTPPPPSSQSAPSKSPSTSSAPTLFPQISTPTPRATQHPSTSCAAHSRIFVPRSLSRYGIQTLDPCSIPRQVKTKLSSKTEWQHGKQRP